MAIRDLLLTEFDEEMAKAGAYSILGGLPFDVITCAAMTPSRREITQILVAWSDGDQAAFDKLTPLVSRELYRLAKRYMARERPGHLLQATALVNEAYLRLIDANQVKWQNRAHFFAVSARVMRRILVDFARSHQNLRRGHARQITFDEAVVVSPEPDANLAAIDKALNALAALHERQSQVVELRLHRELSRGNRDDA
jgi:RNA polymerase sigma factor (TIGR02999 family)